MSVFHKAAKTAFKVAKKLDLVHVAVFKAVYDNGMDDPEISEKKCQIIKERFSMDDLRGLTFRGLIQPTDIKIYVLGENVSDIDTNDVLVVDGIEYTVFGCEIDAAKAMWICGIR